MFPKVLKKIAIILILIICIFIIRFFTWWSLMPKCISEGGIVMDWSKEPCCSELEVEYMNTERVSIDNKCYTFFNGGVINLVARCMDCGDGKCKYYENKCNCPEDCGNKPSDYNITEEFCNSAEFKKYCGPGTRYLGGDNCKICPNYGEPFGN